MPEGDAEERKERARRLRGEIASLKAPKPTPTSEGQPEEEPMPESPRAFIDRKMHELEEGAAPGGPAPPAAGPTEGKR